MADYAPYDQEQHLGKPPWKPSAELLAWEAVHSHDVRLRCYLDRCAVAQEALEQRAEQAEAERDRLAVQVQAVRERLDQWRTDDDLGDHPASCKCVACDVYSALGDTEAGAA